MNRVFLLTILSVFLMLCGASLTYAIEFPEQAPEKHSFNEDQWKKITKGIDYSKEAPPPEEKPRKSVKGPDFNIAPGIGKPIIFILVFALLIFILVRVMKGNMLLGDKKIKDESVFTDVSPNEDIHQSNLEELYAQALAAGNFRLAVRYYYLLVIRELSNKQLITWKKEKTNSDYIFDMMSNAFGKPFREITFLFEKIWYGKPELSEQNFLLVSSRFNEFITEVKNKIPGSETSKPSTDS